MIELADLLAATAGRRHRPDLPPRFTAFAYDSRRLQAGELFVAVQSTTGDGHDYMQAALAAGASAVLCHQPPPDSLPAIVVSDTRQALLDYARYVLRKYQPVVTGVTGSVGKTTTKEAIAHVLATQGPVFKSFGSYNGRYGLPIALGHYEPVQRQAVLEMASDSFGEIAELAALTRPQIGVVTAVRRTHLAKFGSLENIALEKGRLVEALPPEGWAILNIDDPLVRAMAARTNARVRSIGFDAAAEVRATEVRVTPTGTEFMLCYGGRRYPGRVRLLGRHQLVAVLAAVAVGLTYDIDPAASLAALAAMQPAPGRLNPLPGQNDSLLLDDTFNASPDAVKAALDTLADVASGPRLALLGAMADLGDTKAGAHAEVGAYAASRVDYLVGFGEAGQQLVNAAVHAGLPPATARVVETRSDAAEALRDQLRPGAVVLVKASAGDRLERVVARLLANPADRNKLVRSEAGWEQVRIDLPDRPTWVEIDLEALAANTRCLCELAQPAQLMAVLKADGYGHGAVKVGRTVLHNGATWLAVATLGEAITLRRNGIDAPILVLGYMPAWQAAEAIRHNIRATVFTDPVLQAFHEAATRLQLPARLHVKVDTGMGRLGMFPAEVRPFLQAAAELPNVEIEGLFTHFARADEVDPAPTLAQLERFTTVLGELDAAGLRPPLVHAANTAGLINFPQARFDLVRPGIGLYGLSPAAETPLPAAMQAVLSFKTTVAQVKTFPPGHPIGYGATYHTTGEEQIAIIPVGYADGFRRTPQTWGAVLVKGQRAPLVGRVSMDQAAINVSHISNVRQGDEVVLIGRQGSEQITVEEVAARLGTLNYEVISQILARVPRVV